MTLIGSEQTTSSLVVMIWHGTDGGHPRRPRRDEQPDDLRQRQRHVMGQGTVPRPT